MLVTNVGHFSTPLKPGPGGLDPSLIYHSKAHKLLYIPNISDLPDGELTCLPFVPYITDQDLFKDTTTICKKWVKSRFLILGDYLSLKVC